MFAVIARFNDRPDHLIGFASSKDEVNEITASFIENNDREKLEQMGCRFCIELAV